MKSCMGNWVSALGYTRRALVGGTSAMLVWMGVFGALNVAAGDACVAPPQGLVAWWPFEGNGASLRGTNNLNLVGSPAFASGVVGQAMVFDGANDSASTPASANLNVGTRGGLTVETWINPSDVNPLRPIVEWNNGSGGIGTHFWIAVPTSMGGGRGSLFGNFIDLSGVSHQITSGLDVIRPGTNQHVALTYDRTSGTASLYVNGSRVAQTNLGSFVSQTSYPLQVGYRPSGAFSGIRFQGTMDELGIYDRALSQDEIQTIYVAGGGGKCQSEPPPVCVPAPNGLAAWWPFEGNGASLRGSNNLNLVGSPVFASGVVGQAMVFDGANDAASTPPSANLNVGAGGGLTVETWINPTDVSQLRPILEWNNGSGGIGTHFWIAVPTSMGGGRGSLFGNFIDLNGVSHQITTGLDAIRAGTNQHVALTYDRTSGIASLYVNGSRAAQTNLGSFVSQTSYPLQVGYRPSGPFSGIRFSGKMDELSLYGRALSLDEVGAIYRAGSGGKCESEPPPPPACSPAADGLVAWWPMEENAGDLAGNSHGVLNGAPSFAAGEVGRAMVFDGQNDDVIIPRSHLLNLATASGFSVELWVRPTDLSHLRPLVEWNSGNVGVHLWLGVDVETLGDGEKNVFANIIDRTGASHQVSSPKNTAVAGQWQHVALTYNRSNGRTAIYHNGVVVADRQLGVFTPATEGDLHLGLRPSGPFSGIRFVGIMDEVSVYDRALNPTEISAIHAAGVSGKCTHSVPEVNYPPVALAQSLSTFEDTAVTIILQGEDPDGDSLQYIVGNPTNGALSGVPPNLTYTPVTGFVGIDEFGYKVSDGRRESEEVKVTISVADRNAAPTASPQSVTLQEDGAIEIQLVATDPDGDPLVFNVGSPSHGRLTGVAPNLVYTPNPNFFGVDSFVFKVSDGRLESAQAMVTITVRPVQDPPVPVVRLLCVTDVDGSEKWIAVSRDGTNAVVVLDGTQSFDPDSDPLEFTWFADGNVSPIAAVALTTNAFELGEHSVTLVLSDGNSVASKTIGFEVLTIPEALDELCWQIQSSSIETNRKRPLMASCEAAKASFARGNRKSCANQLGALREKFEAQIEPRDWALARQWDRFAECLVKAIDYQK